jgi:hypothetical protein
VSERIECVILCACERILWTPFWTCTKAEFDGWDCAAKSATYQLKPLKSSPGFWIEQTCRNPLCNDLVRTIAKLSTITNNRLYHVLLVLKNLCTKVHRKFHIEATSELLFSCVNLLDLPIEYLFLIQLCYWLNGHWMCVHQLLLSKLRAGVRHRAWQFGRHQEIALCNVWMLLRLNFNSCTN